MIIISPSSGSALRPGIAEAVLPRAAPAPHLRGPLLLFFRVLPAAPGGDGGAGVQLGLEGGARPLQEGALQALRRTLQVRRRHIVHEIGNVWRESIPSRRCVIFCRLVAAALERSVCVRACVCPFFEFRPKDEPISQFSTGGKFGQRFWIGGGPTKLPSSSF